MSLPGNPREPYDVAMLQSTTRQGTDYGAQRDLEGEGVLNDSGNRGPEHRTLRRDLESDVGPRSRSSSRESKSSGSMGSPKGSPVAGKKLSKERLTEDIKREDDRDYARFKFLCGLKELGRLAPTTTEAVVAVANGLGLYKALLLDMGVPRDSVEKVMQIYLSCYGHFLTKDEEQGKSHHRGYRDRRDNEDEVKQASSGRGSGEKDHRGDRRSNGERGTVPTGLNYPLGRIHADIGNPGMRTGRLEEGICRYGRIPL